MTHKNTEQIRRLIERSSMLSEANRSALLEVLPDLNENKAEELRVLLESESQRISGLIAEVLSTPEQQTAATFQEFDETLRTSLAQLRAAEEEQDAAQHGRRFPLPRLQ